ncbi:MAG TPA: 8-amino-7-oxononanoate synthase, partial [Alphaproteobacteria bacterium]|nr:8-amino-7-oxononanoate synthase [Alphaproteobacteria bacterium]
MSKFDDLYGRWLERLARAGLRRALRATLPDDPGRVRVDGRALINLSSNDYLGLARHPALIARAQAFAARFGAGAGASRLITGNLEPFETIEGKLARLKGTESSLVLGSGFLANSVTIPALLRREALEAEPLVFSDELNHASIVHGVKAARVAPVLYRHNDLDHLESLLKEHTQRTARPFILTESVFSMDGDRADLKGLVALAERYGAFLYVDEAHATGVLGPRGMGLACEYAGRIDLIMGTFSKALGSYGAYLACSAVVRDYLINRASGLIYSTALPPPVLGAIDAALDLVPGLEAERRRLHANAERLRRAFRTAGLNIGRSSTQIVPVILGEPEAVMGAARALEAEGILAVAIRPPTVPEGTGRIRFA